MSHMHVPFQHTHHAVLKRMARPRVDKVIQNFKNFNRFNSRIGIGPDVIVGFPGETDIEFERMLKDLTDCPLSYIHVFSYSPRPDTVAGKRTDMVDPAVMKYRSGVLLDLDKKKRNAFRELHTGVVAVVIPDDGPVGREFISAVSDNYLKIKMVKAASIAGKCVNVKLAMDESNILIGSTV